MYIFKKSIYYISAFIFSLLVIYLFLYFKLGKYYMDFSSNIYCLNDIINEANENNLSINDYNIYFDNKRKLTDTEKDLFNNCTLKYVPRYKAIYKSLIDDRLFFLRVFDNDSELFYFYHTRNGTYVEYLHWGESIYDVNYAFFEVENLDLGFIYNKELKNSIPKLHSYQNNYYDMSNSTIFILSLIIIFVAEITIYIMLRKKQTHHKK